MDSDQETVIFDDHSVRHQQKKYYHTKHHSNSYSDHHSSRHHPSTHPRHVPSQHSHHRHKARSPVHRRRPLFKATRYSRMRLNESSIHPSTGGFLNALHTNRFHIKSGWERVIIPSTSSSHPGRYKGDVREAGHERESARSQYVDPETLPATSSSRVIAGVPSSSGSERPGDWKESFYEKEQSRSNLESRLSPFLAGSRHRSNEDSAYEKERGRSNLESRLSPSLAGSRHRSNEDYVYEKERGRSQYDPGTSQARHLEPSEAYNYDNQHLHNRAQPSPTSSQHSPRESEQNLHNRPGFLSAMLRSSTTGFSFLSPPQTHPAPPEATHSPGKAPSPPQDGGLKENLWLELLRVLKVAKNMDSHVSLSPHDSPSASPHGYTSPSSHHHPPHPHPSQPPPSPSHNRLSHLSSPPSSEREKMEERLRSHPPQIFGLDRSLYTETQNFPQRVKTDNGVIPPISNVWVFVYCINGQTQVQVVLTLHGRCVPEGAV